MQFGFMAASFLLPMPLKDAWAEFALGTINDVAWLATAAGLAGYGAFTGRLLSRYRVLLAARNAALTRARRRAGLAVRRELCSFCQGSGTPDRRNLQNSVAHVP